MDAWGIIKRAGPSAIYLVLLLLQSWYQQQSQKRPQSQPRGITRRQRKTLWIGWVIAFAVSAFVVYSGYRKDAEYAALQSSNDTLNANLSEVLTDNDSLKADLAEIKTLVQPMSDVAGQLYPRKPSDSALMQLAHDLPAIIAKVRSDVQGLAPSVRLVGNTSPLSDHTSGLIGVTYYFRGAPEGTTLGNVRIVAKFSSPIVRFHCDATGPLGGAAPFVLSGVGESSISLDSLECRCLATQLMPGNDLALTVLSSAPSALLEWRYGF